MDKDSKHIEPMAQDFYAAFGVGPDNKHITTIDESGVALAAIQGLNAKLQDEAKEKEAAIQMLKIENRSLEKRLNTLERLVKSIAANK